MKTFLPTKIAEKYVPLVSSPQFITRHPNRREIDLRKISSLKEAEALAKEGYLKKKTD